MARKFRDLPIALKALILGIVPTITAILLVMSASMFSTYMQAQTNMTLDLQAESALVADNVSAAVAFDDRQTAEGALRGYRSKTNIDAVCVFDATGAVFASYTRTPGRCDPSRTFADPSSITEEAAVVAGDRRIGTVRVIGNFSRLQTWIWRQAGVGLMTFLVGVLGSLLVTRQLARYITAPVEHLVTTTQQVSETQDYTIRATKTTDDEVGHLVGSFNEMLDRIHAQSVASAALLEREQEASRLKDQFLATLSHELRTPLNAILGWLQIIQNTNPSRQALDRAIENVQRNAQAQARVVEDLIDVARVTSGKLQLHLAIVDVRLSAQAAFNVIDPAAQSKGIEVTLNLPDVPCPVRADADRLQQIIWNLASNAVKFTPSGGAVNVNLAREEGDAVLEVSDTGIGIPAEFLPFVFERFRQADGSMTREQGGLGLGLSIAKELAELHGGSLAVKSLGRGKGTTFILRVPWAKTAVLTSTGAIPANLADRSLDGVHVLVVDDDIDSLNIVAEALRAAGADVQTAESGAEALEQWERQPMDVLVSDLAMPQVDGFAVVAAIRHAPDSTRRLLAVALSAHTLESDRERALAAGFDQHIAKPVNLGQLVAAIHDGVNTPKI